MRHINMPKKPSRKAFIADFRPLERALAQGVSCPVERIIVELGITPSNVRAIERAAGARFHWFRPTYAAMKKHGLIPINRSWGDWLKRYNRAKNGCQIL